MIKKIITLWLLTGGQMYLLHSLGNLPAKPTINSTCASNSGAVNAYLADVQYLTILNEFIKGLQEIIHQYQNAIGRNTKEMQSIQTHIEILRTYTDQKLTAIKTVQDAITKLENDKSESAFKYMNDANCLFEGSKVALMVFQLMEKTPDKKNIQPAIDLLDQILTIVKFCSNSGGISAQKAQDVLKETKQIIPPFTSAPALKLPAKAQAVLKSLEAEKKNSLPQKSEDFAIQATAMFDNIKRRILNEFAAITLGKEIRPEDKQKTCLTPILQKQTGAQSEEDLESKQETLINLKRNLNRTASQKNFNKVIKGFESAIAEIKPTKQRWLGTINLLKFGYNTCNCQQQCAAAANKPACMKECEERGRNTLGYTPYDCQSACVASKDQKKSSVYETCLAVCKDDPQCKLTCQDAQNSCLKTCQEEYKQNDDNWNECTQIAQRCTSNPKTSECTNLQPIGIADIQGEITALAKQIEPVADSKNAPAINIAAKIDRLMNKIKQVQTLIEQAKKAVESTKSAVDTRSIDSLLPTDKNQKKTCAESIKSIIESKVDVAPALTAIDNLKKELQALGSDE